MKLLLLFGGGGVVCLQLQSSYFALFYFIFGEFFGCLHLQRGKKTKPFFYCWIRFDCLKLMQCWSETIYSFIQPWFSILDWHTNFSMTFYFWGWTKELNSLLMGKEGFEFKLLWWVHVLFNFLLFMVFEFFNSFVFEDTRMRFLLHVLCVCGGNFRKFGSRPLRRLSGFLSYILQFFFWVSGFLSFGDTLLKFLTNVKNLGKYLGIGWTYCAIRMIGLCFPVINSIF